MDFLEKIGKDLAEAMKSQVADRELQVSVLRMMKSSVKNAEIAKRTSGKELTEDDIIAVLSTMVKQRKEAAEQYEKASRPDLARKEDSEIRIIQKYLPEQLSTDDLDGIIRTTISETGASGMKDLGKLMKELMPKVKGKTDGKVVSERVKALLGQ